MAKVTGALLSLGGTGALGKTLVYATWRGIKYVRQYVIPENPKTVAQSLTRDVFKMLTQAWKLAPAGFKAPWDAHASGRKYTGSNKFIGENVRTMRGEVDLALFVGSPGARGGLPPDSISAVAGVGTLTVTVVDPQVPIDWTLVGSQGVCVLDQDPNVDFVGPWSFEEDLVDPFDTLSFTGLPAGLTFCYVWAKWTKPDGRTAYSVALTDSDTVT